MRATWYLLALLGMCLPSAAQATAKADVFGGYSYLNVGTKYLSSRESLHGWESSLSVDVSRLFSIEGDVSGHYKSVSASGVSGTVSDYTFAGGPRVNFRPVFAHVLVGSDRVGASAFGFTASHSGLSVAAGGGVQWPVSNKWSVRLSADYVFNHHHVTIPGVVDTSITLNNVRVATGIVYSFGRGGARTAKSAQRPQPTEARPGQSGTIRIAQLGVLAEDAEDGAAIISLDPGGPAEQAGLRPGDVIKAVDGTRMRSSRDLAVDLAAKTAGSVVKVAYARRYWDSETSIKLP